MLLNIIPSVILSYYLCVKNNFDYMNMAATVNILTFHAHTTLSFVKGSCRFLKTLSVL